jgi:D-glycero-D-manno-heptose 1,7-bisphosphate phosphatase
MTAANERLAPAVFLDRDGTLMEDVDYCGNPRDVKVFGGAGDALRRLKDRGFRLFIITNQSGIGRGYFTEEHYQAVHAEFLRQLGSDLIDGAYYCPDRPESPSKRRKPSPEMLFEAQREHRLDLSRSFFIGDKAIDVQCGRAAGVRTILVETGYGKREAECRPDWKASDVAAAAKIILTRVNE